MKIAKSSSVYPGLLKQLYLDDKTLHRAPYSRQLEKIITSGFSFGDTWKYHLEKLGEFSVQEIVVNAESAQKSWASENKVPYSIDHWQYDILLSQLQHQKPDVWFCHAWLPAEVRKEIKERCPSIKLTIGYDGALNHNPDAMSGCDIIISCVRDTIDYYAQNGVRGYWMRWGFDSRLLPRIFSQRNRYEVTFCGSIILQRNVGHFDRLKLLCEASRVANISIFCGDLPFNHFELEITKNIIKLDWDLAVRGLRTLPWLWAIRKRTKSELYGLPMLEALASSACTLNMHGYNVRSAANIRMFEATGCGTCLVTDWKSDIRDIFEPDTEIVTYKNIDEAKEKVRFLVENPKIQQGIAAMGKRRCLAQHDFKQRIEAFAAEVLHKI